jgi:hypothetical protein
VYASIQSHFVAALDVPKTGGTARRVDTAVPVDCLTVSEYMYVFNGVASVDDKDID